MRIASLWPVVAAAALGLTGCAADTSQQEQPNEQDGGGGAQAGQAGASGQGGQAGQGGGQAGEAGSGNGGAGSGGGQGGSGGSHQGGSGGGVSGPDASVQVGAPDRILLKGVVVTPDTSFVGEVLVEGDVIKCVSPGTACESETGASGATIIETKGVISPGLIDTHNHILFDIFDGDDWLPEIPQQCNKPADCESSTYCKGGKCDCVAGTCKYFNHKQWPKEAVYGLMLDYKQCLEDASQGKPAWCPTKYDGTGRLKCEMDKWGELKGLIAGTTSIVGLPGTSSKCFGSLARSIDVRQNDLAADKVQTSALFPPSASSANGVCANFSDGDTNAYLIHCGEGVDSTALGEFSTMYSMTSTDGCLYAPQTAITHGVAFSSSEYSKMAKAGMKLTWSPASNVALYGDTNDLPAAIAAGLTISLAPDWSMGGSQNILDEMRFANKWDDDHFGDVLSAKDLVQMTTVNAAAVLSLANTIGRLEPGFKADLMVVGGDTAKPYEAIMWATPKDVRLVMVGGKILYGDDQLEPAAPTNPGCEGVNICGRDKFLCVAESSSADKLNQTYAQIKTALDGALQDLDGIKPLPAASCSPACGSSEECFKRVVYPQVGADKCGNSCGASEACFQRYQSGSHMYQCMSVNTCAPKKSKGFYPVAPIVHCP